ncbi:MAG: transglycosylase domain-containing protein [Bacteroidales bacterium]|jgi:penicillin-binding protein 1A|nr:transglycosylase domain-containing protein [Bacteroidales bacterium]
MNKIKFTTKLYTRLFWSLVLIPILTIIIIFILISLEKLGEMPTFKELENPDNNLASEIYSDDGVLIGNLFWDNRSYANYNEIPKNVLDALIATEDIRFHTHSGIDARGLGRVLVYSILMGKQSSGGGSTITQQLAKNLFPRDTTTYNSSLGRKVHLGVSKFKEWVTAVKLERNYTKDEIIVMYLNTVPFGGIIYGIKSAAKTYFNIPPDSLRIEQSALLVGLLRAPTYYSPLRNPERSKLRRNVVLNQMNKYDFITNAEFDSLSILPIELNYKIQDHNVGLATYFREYLRLTLNKSKPNRKNYYSVRDYRNDSIEWLTNPMYGWCKKNKKPDGSDHDLYRDGLKIYTTIDSRMQKYAEEALVEHLSTELQNNFNVEQENNPNAPYYEELSSEELKDIIDLAIRRTERYRRLRRRGVKMDSIKAIFNSPVEMTVFTWEGDIDTIMTPLDSLIYYKNYLRAGFISVDPHNGFVKAYVGGPNFKHFKYDHVTQGKRQVGSTIKPFLYTLAMQEGYSPCHKVPNIPSTFILGDTTWTPKNSGPTTRDGQMVTLKWGLSKSVNYISAWLIKQFNPVSVIDVMRKMGVKSKIAAVPSIFLGTSDISLSEMTSAYSTFSNKGVHSEPVFVTRIEDKNGNILAKFTSNKNEAISAQTAFLMTKLLQSVVLSGSGGSIRWKYELYNEIGGKTGTTQNQSDGWFMGVTPNLVSGVWVGGEDRSIHFKGLRQGGGHNMALPIFGLYMQKVYKDSTLSVTQEDKFDEPINFSINLDCEKYEENQTNQESFDSEFF